MLVEIDLEGRVVCEPVKRGMWVSPDRKDDLKGREAWPWFVAPSV